MNRTKLNGKVAWNKGFPTQKDRGEPWRMGRGLYTAGRGELPKGSSCRGLEGSLWKQKKVGMFGGKVKG